jgi:hypothetical protein
MGGDYDNCRTAVTPDGLPGLALKVRRRHSPGCPAYKRPSRPEAEGRYALPRHELGLDVIAAGGAVRHAEHRPVPVSRSYWAGLFPCYGVADLPRTNDALEQSFGAHRYHGRRASGRKGASPALVLRGAGRVIAAAAPRARPYTAEELATAEREDWQQLRQELGRRRQRRTGRTRFRRNPQVFLNQLEQKLFQLPLLS